MVRSALCSIAILLAAACSTVHHDTSATQDSKQTQEPSPEMLALMAPGPMHAKLEPLMGRWKMSGRWRMAPDAPWQEMQADVERHWILDGRFLHETVRSDWMGQPFEGIGIIGYDNLLERYTMIWMDNMTTGTWVSHGHFKDGKFVFEGENSNPMTGEKHCWNRSVLDPSGDAHVYTGYGKDASGKEYVHGEMTAVRP